MLDKNGKRMLAYIQQVSEIKSIDGADNIELASVLGWTLIVLKNEFKVGDKCVFFEIDAKVPEDNPAFDFLASKHYKIKTYKLSKFGVISQGLILPLDKLGIDANTPILTDMTEKLGVSYIIPEDNVRKTDRLKDQIKTYKSKHKKFFDNFIVRKLMRFKFFKWLFLLPMNKGKKDFKRAFPTSSLG